MTEETKPLLYRVGTLRDAGLEARWSKTRSGRPTLVARHPLSTRKNWWVVDSGMWRQMNKHGVMEGFEGLTMLGDIFSVKA
jgi:hypothetical protein